MFKITLIEDEDKKSKIVSEIIRQLPDWFDEKAKKEYPENVRLQIFYAVYNEAEEIGFVSLKVNNIYTADIYALGVLEQYHRMGIGRNLIYKVEQFLRENRYKFLMVKTLSDSVEYKPYEKTRAFYKSVGFYPLQEIREIWGEENPCLIMVKNI